MLSEGISDIITKEQIDVLDLSNPSAPTKLFDIDVSALGTPNSVDTRIGLVAVAIEAPVKTDPGKVAFYRPNGKLVRTVDSARCRTCSPSRRTACSS